MRRSPEAAGSHSPAQPDGMGNTAPEKATRATAPCTAGRHGHAIPTCDNAQMCAVARSRGQSQPRAQPDGMMALFRVATMRECAQFPEAAGSHSPAQPDGMGNTAPEKATRATAHAQPDGMRALFRLATMRECARSPEAAGSHSPAHPDGMGNTAPEKATRATAPYTAGRHEGAIPTCDNARMCAVARSRRQSQPHAA